jgi:hypothetical protein
MVDQNPDHDNGLMSIQRGMTITGGSHDQPEYFRNNTSKNGAVAIRAHY